MATVKKVDNVGGNPLAPWYRVSKSKALGKKKAKKESPRYPITSGIDQFGRKTAHHYIDQFNRPI